MGPFSLSMIPTQTCYNYLCNLFPMYSTQNLHRRGVFGSIEEEFSVQQSRARPLTCHTTRRRRLPIAGLLLDQSLPCCDRCGPRSVLSRWYRRLARARSSEAFVKECLKAYLRAFQVCYTAACFPGSADPASKRAAYCSQKKKRAAYVTLAQFILLRPFPSETPLV